MLYQTSEEKHLLLYNFVHFYKITKKTKNSQADYAMWMMVEVDDGRLLIIPVQ
jgi:hypothetical protein